MIRSMLIAAMIVLAPTSAWSADPWPPAPPWTSPLARHTAATGDIRDVRDGRTVTPTALIERLAAVDFVLLGERHDNADHHRLQAWIAEHLFARGHPYALAFEMIDSHQSTKLNDYLAASPPDAAGLGAALDWSDSGWPDWALYRPIATAAVTRRLPILAANLPLDLVRGIAKDGINALPPALAQSLQLAPDRDAAILAAHGRDIQAAHCGMLPERSLAPFALAQYARDAEMARAMVSPWQRSIGKTGVVLIAGAGHVRRDRGVPFHLARMAPNAKILSLAFVEAPDDGAEVDWAALPYDLVWMTARVDDGDFCAQMRKPD